MASGGGYAWALAAGLNAALAAISAKFFAPMLLKYGMVILFNVTMWGCYVNSLKALSSLQATVTNFAANFISSGLAGYFLFQEPLPSKWFAGASLIILGVFILSKSTHQLICTLVRFEIHHPNCNLVFHDETIQVYGRSKPSIHHLLGTAVRISSFSVAVPDVLACVFSIARSLSTVSPEGLSMLLRYENHSSSGEVSSSVRATA
ncbi:hypothetical protein ZWY2020_035271 [Hordeum vulgare]|nr:hypothetical protein ZWY2020_035271 [Hordeum vulgare]